MEESYDDFGEVSDIEGSRTDRKMEAKEGVQQRLTDLTHCPC